MSPTFTRRPASARGHANHGWLDSHHTFSFADYHDPAHMGFGPLRVINEDRVQPGRGFGTHPHRDMEIISYVVSGELAHRDTLGTGSVIRPGEVQLMRAGTGIAHSEMNPSPTTPVHFLQIWILPAHRGSAPAYAQRDFGRNPGVTLVVSPDGRDGSLAIDQDVDLYRALLPAGASASVPHPRPRAWIQVIAGALTVGDQPLTAGDGLAVTGSGPLELRAGDASVEALIFDLA